MMFKLSSFTFAALAVLSVSSTDAFTPKPTSVSTSGAPNWTSTSLNIFGGALKEGKYALVRSLAGEYDKNAIQERVQGLIDASPVLMFSFTT